MIKKASVFLLPLIAVLFCIYSNTSSRFAGSSSGTHLYTFATRHCKLPVSSDIRKDSHIPNKNKIRPKAWDYYTGIAAASLDIPDIKVFPSPQNIFGNANDHIVDPCHSCGFLRGPPDVI